MDIYRPEIQTSRGCRINNEDFVYPNYECDANQKLFMVCDGVGGQSYGEVASQHFTLSVVDYFRLYASIGLGAEKITKSIKYGQLQIKLKARANTDYANMATTYTLLHLGEDRVWVSWQGDSRIYLFRNGAIRYKTTDHSLLQELLDRKALSDEEVNRFPYKNMITKCVSANGENHKPEVFAIDDVAKGDCFFMCTDGVIESWADEELCHVFNGHNSLPEINKKISEQCMLKSKDNYSFCIIGIREI